MSKINEARPTVGAVEQAKAEAVLADKHSSVYCTSTPATKQPQISDLLRPGSGNGIRLSELVQLIGEDERSVRRRIQGERKAGKLILSDNASGYFLPASADDVRRFVRSMSRRAREISAIALVAEDVLAQAEGQEVVEGWR